MNITPQVCTANRSHYLLSTLTAMLLILASFSSVANTPKRVLFVISAHQYGYWLPELVTPLRILADAGIKVDIASPGGSAGRGVASGRLDALDREYLPLIQKALDAPLALIDVNSDQYAGVYFVGGAGPMLDLYNHPQVNRLVNDFNDTNKVISADCHGPVALAGVRLSNGEWFISNRKVTAKSNAEEGRRARSRYPFLLEDRLKQNKAHFSAAAPGEAYVVVDGNLLTGQNPASAEPLAHKLVELVLSL